MHFLTSNATSQNFWKMCFIKNIPAILQSTNDQPFLDAFQKLYGFNAGLQFAPSAVTKKMLWLHPRCARRDASGNGIILKMKGCVNCNPSSVSSRLSIFPLAAHPNDWRYIGYRRKRTPLQNHSILCTNS